MSFLDSFLLIAIGQGVFLSFAIQLIQKKNKEANQILVSLIAIACIMLLGRVTFESIGLDWIWKVAILVDTTIFLFGPLLYLYVRRITTDDSVLFTLNLLHFILPFLHLIYALICTLLPSEIYTELYLKGYFNITGFIVEFLGITSFIYYLIRSFLYLTFLIKINHQNSSSEPEVFNYILILLVSISVFSLMWVLSFSSYFIPPIRSLHLNYGVMWIAIPLFFYVVGFYSFWQPQLFRVKIEDKLINAEQRRRMSSAEVLKTQALLNTVMKEKKVFKNPELSLTDLSDQLGLSTNDLSWFLNAVYKKSFYTFVNEHRIDEFISKVHLQEHKKQTILSLAMDVGFNSKSTFNKFFKELLDQTPSQYIKSL